jgi:ABC-2 type transport system permease protein
MTMRLWADDRRSGMVDLLLVSPLSEKELILGKYLGVLTAVVFIILLSLITPLCILVKFAPALDSSISFFSFLPAVGILIVHAMLWCSIGSWMSTLAKNSAIAAFVSFLLMAALPYIAYRAILEWMPALRATMPEYPFLRSLSDFVTGYISTGALVFYFAFTFFSLFASTKALAVLRLAGRGGRSTRFTAFCAVACGFVFTVLVCLCGIRFNISIDLPFASRDVEFSERTKSILSDTSGNVSVTCFMSRRDPEFRMVSRLLRALASVSKASAGARVSVEFVDPRWDIGRAAHIVRQGAAEGSIIFSRGRRRTVVPVSSLFASPADLGDTPRVISPSGVFVGETVCASAIRKLSLPQRNDIIYWTTGHGEASFDNYDRVYGMSDIVRDLRQDGFLLKKLDLTTVPAVPEDCSILFVASARDAFSVTELSRITGYLRKGGRLLVLADEKQDAGIGRLLMSWGVRLSLMSLCLLFRLRGRIW